jgi:hypothetical protein
MKNRGWQPLDAMIQTQYPILISHPIWVRLDCTGRVILYRCTVYRYNTGIFWNARYTRYTPGKLGGTLCGIIHPASIPLWFKIYRSLTLNVMWIRCVRTPGKRKICTLLAEHFHSFRWRKLLPKWVHAMVLPRLIAMLRSCLRQIVRKVFYRYHSTTRNAPRGKKHARPTIDWSDPRLVLQI